MLIIYSNFKYYIILSHPEYPPNSQSDTDPNQNDLSTHENTQNHNKNERSYH